MPQVMFFSNSTKVKMKFNVDRVTVNKNQQEETKKQSKVVVQFSKLIVAVCTSEVRSCDSWGDGDQTIHHPRNKNIY